ncbi:hypothetical protein [Flavobacterium sp. W20_MBD1_R3]
MAFWCVVKRRVDPFKPRHLWLLVRGEKWKVRRRRRRRRVDPFIP